MKQAARIVQTTLMQNVLDKTAGASRVDAKGTPA